MADKIRIVSDGPFTPLPNKTIRDRRLSLRTLGLLLLMHSLPEDWDYTVAGLATICDLSRDTTGKALKELEAAGYLTRHQLHGKKGTFGGCEYVVTAVSQDGEDKGDAPPLPKNPSTVLPSTALPLTDFSAQRKKRTNSNTTPLNPPKKGKRKAEPESDWLPERFEAFWKCYPHDYRGNKQRARRAWNKLRPEGDVLTAMGRALKRWMRSERWLSGIGIPNASTYISPDNGYWELEDATAPAVPQSQDASPAVVVESRYEKL